MISKTIFLALALCAFSGGSSKSSKKDTKQANKDSTSAKPATDPAKPVKPRLTPRKRGIMRGRNSALWLKNEREYQGRQAHREAMKPVFADIIKFDKKNLKNDKIRDAEKAVKIAEKALETANQEYADAKTDYDNKTGAGWGGVDLFDFDEDTVAKAEKELERAKAKVRDAKLSLNKAKKELEKAKGEMKAKFTSSDVVEEEEPAVVEEENPAVVEEEQPKVHSDEIKNFDKKSLKKTTEPAGRFENDNAEERVKTAQTAFDKATEVLAAAKKKAEEAKRWAKDDLTYEDAATQSQQEFEDATTEFKKAKADLKKAQRELQQIKNDLAVKDLPRLASAVKDAKASVEKAKKKAADTPVTAANDPSNVYAAIKAYKEKADAEKQLLYAEAQFKKAKIVKNTEKFNADYPPEKLTKTKNDDALRK